MGTPLGGIRKFELSNEWESLDGVPPLCHVSRADQLRYTYCSNSWSRLSCGLVAGKSLMLAAIVVQNVFRPDNGRSVRPSVQVAQNAIPKKCLCATCRRHCQVAAILAPPIISSIRRRGKNPCNDRRDQNDMKRRATVWVYSAGVASLGRGLRTRASQNQRHSGECCRMSMATLVGSR